MPIICYNEYFLSYLPLKAFLFLFFSKLLLRFYTPPLVSGGIFIPPTYEICQRVYSFCHSVCSSDRPSVRLVVSPFVNFTSKFCIKPFVIAHISVTLYQILFIFSLLYLYSFTFDLKYQGTWVRALGGGQGSIIMT